MAANTQPIFVLTPVLAAVRLTTGNANRDGSGTLTTLLTGATNGTRVDRIVVAANVTTTAGMVRFFIDDGSGTIKLIKEIAVTAVTPSGSVAAFTSEWVRADTLPLLVLPSAFILKCATNNSEQCDVTCYGGSY